METLQLDAAGEAASMQAAPADRFLAIPYKSRGRSYDGADCWGLVFLYYRDVMGIDLADWSHVSSKALRSVSRLILEHKAEWLKVDQPRDGDVAIMRAWTKRGTIEDTHVGLVVNRRYVLHTEQQSGAKLERLSAPHVAARIVDYRRHPRAA